MVGSAEKYRKVLTDAYQKGYETSITIDALKQCLMEQFTVKENSFYKFHIKNMETLGLITLVQPGLWSVDTNKVMERS